MGIHYATVTRSLFGGSERIRFFYDGGRLSSDGGDGETGQEFPEFNSSTSIEYERRADGDVRIDARTGSTERKSGGESESREDLVKSIRNSYHSLLGFCLARGLSYNDFLSMTMNEVNSFIEGNIKGREQVVNDLLFVAYTQSALTSQAIWGLKEFPKEPPKIKIDNPFDPKTKEEIIADIINYQRKVYDEFQLMNLTQNLPVRGWGNGRSESSDEGSE